MLVEMKKCISLFKTSTLLGFSMADGGMAGWIVGSKMSAAAASYLII